VLCFVATKCYRPKGEYKRLWNLPKEKFSRMPSSGMLRHVALVGTDVSEERNFCTIRFTRMGELATALSSNVPRSPILGALMMEAIRSS
jgi:hypothetical protein